MNFRLDPEQRFTCRSCGRCCRRWDVLITEAERDAFTKRGVARWFRENEGEAEGTNRDPFEPVPGWRGYFRIRSRSDGACGFLSSSDRCRIHEELGAAAKPLTCRMFPFSFHRAPATTVVTASFGCPTIVDNRGERVADEPQRRALERLRDQWSNAPLSTAGARSFVRGRPIDAPSLNILRDNLLRILARAEAGAIDLRANVQRIARIFDDLTRRRVLGLDDQKFAEYIKLTVPYAANNGAPVTAIQPGAIGRLMQFGFLFLVSVTRYGIEHRHESRLARRAAALRLLAHFHRLAPRVDRVNVGVLRRQRIDINDPRIQPVAYHYLRASIEAIGARDRPIVDDFAIAVSCLNAACALAIMNAHAAGRAIDRESFSEAMMESVDVLQMDQRGLLGWALPRLAAGTEALKLLSAPDPFRK